MEYRNLGRSGIRVSSLCLGTMSYGWTTDEKTSHAMLDRYVDSGGNFIDTADIYAEGQAEEIVGRWLGEKSRDDIVLATKVRYATGLGVNDVGLSRKHILSAVEASLRRLNTDYIDLYQVHCWDDKTPLEETLTTLDRLVRDGKVRYPGVCNHAGWHLQKAVDVARQMGLTPYVCLQALYNLLDRYLEWDLLPVCRSEGLGLLCWSPLGGGWLTGAIRPGMTAPPEGGRIDLAEKGGWSESWSNYNCDDTWKILEEFLAVAEEIEKTPAQVALRWLLQRPTVTSAILGAETMEQLDDNLGAYGWTLDDKQMKRLNAVSEKRPPRYPYGFLNRFIAHD